MKTTTTNNRRLLIILTLLYFKAPFFAQSINQNGSVISEIQFGHNFMYYIELNNGGLLRTNILPSQLLEKNKTVNLIPTLDDSEYLVETSNMEYQIAAYLIDQNSGIFIDEMTIFDEFQLPRFDDDLGILIFKDFEHLEEVYSYLEEIDSLYESIDLDEIIDLFLYKYPNYYSYYEDYNKVYHHDFSYTEEDFKEKNKNWFIYDDIFKAFFNSNRFIGIGGKIYFQADKNLRISFDMNNNPALSNILYEKDFEKFRGDTNFVFQRLDLFEIENEDNDNMSIRNSFYAAEINTCFQSNIIKYSRACPFTKALKVEIRKYLGSNCTSPNTSNIPPFNLSFYANRVLTINWGDGSPIQIINNYNGQEIEHTYPTSTSSINYNVQTKLEFIASGVLIELNDGHLSDGQIIMFNTNPNNACFKLTIDDVTSVYSPNGLYLLECFHWFYPNGRFGAKTVVYKKIGNVYKNVKEQHRTYIYGKAFKENDCSFHATKFENKVKNRKYTRVSKKFNSNRRYKDFTELDRSYSLHQINLGGSSSIGFKWHYLGCQ